MMKSVWSLSSLLVAAGALALVTVTACDDSPTGSEQANVTMQSQLTTNSVTFAKSLAPAVGATVDSLRVTKVRILVSRLKMHRDKADTTGDKDVKIPAFVMTFESGATTFANAAIEPGTYDKVKFEFHRPEGSQVAQYLQDPVLVDFVTGGQYTVILDVTLYVDGAPITYQYKSDVNANLSLNFDNAITLDGGTTTVIVLHIDPADVFKDGNLVLDPRDASNESKIDNAIKAAIKAHKK